MALKISTDLKNFIVNNTVKAMAGTMGTGGSCVISIYSGTQPTNADAATNGTILCTITGVAWGTIGSAGTIGATAGTAALNGTKSNTASTGGTAGWARMETFGTGFTGSAGTFRIDGDVGTGGTCTFVINAVIFNAGDTISLLTAPVYLS
jgi:hypothetical protein